MTNEEMQRQLDALEKKRHAIGDALLRHNRESNSVISNIRETVSTMQKTVEDIVEHNNGTRTKRNTARA